MGDELTLIRSKVNPENGEPLLNTMTLITGAGNVVFENGVARVTPEQLDLLRGHESIDFDQAGAMTVVATSDPGAHARGLPDGLVDASDDELTWLGDLLNLLRGIPQWQDPDERAQLFEGIASVLRLDDVDTPQPTPTSDQAPQTPQEPAQTPGSVTVQETETEGDPALPAPEDLEVNPELEAARAHLRSEGEHVPKVLPNGFEALTAEGEPRCYARKGDGSQCANAAKRDDENNSTYACGLAKHQEQVAKLP